MDIHGELINKLTQLLDKINFDEKRKEELENQRKEKERAFENEEEKKLKKAANITFLILSIVIIISTFLTCILTLNNKPLIFICISVGILGSSTTALISALDRKSNGWESNKGDKFPEDGKMDRFSIRMHTFFLFRPLLGIAAGLIVFFGSLQTSVNYSSFPQNSKIIFYSLVAGLFIKTLLDKLKSLLEKLLGVFVK